MDTRKYNSVLLVAALLVIGTTTAFADQILVTRTDDPSPGDCVFFPVPDCSLREAVLLANSLSGTDTVILPNGTFLLSRAGAGEDGGLTGDLDITDDLEIEGQSRLSTIVDGGAIDRVLHVADGVSVTLNDLTLRNGSVTGSGGGILSGTGSLSLTQVAVRNSTSSDRGGGISSNGPLDLAFCKLLDNFAGNEGGGVFAGGPATVSSCEFDGNTGDYEGGGGWFSQDTALITRSTFTNNFGGLYGCGLGASGSMTLVDCEIAFNEFLDNNGYGAGIHTWGPLVVQNCSIHDNNGDDGFAGGISVVGASAKITNTTFYDNWADFPGTDIYLQNGASAELDHVTVVYSGAEAALGAESALESFQIKNSLVYGGCSAGLSVTTLGGNLESDGSSCGFDHPTDLDNVNLLDLDIGAGLADNGGSTSTVALGPSSVAANRIQKGCGAADQRGLPRPLDGTWCDSGAFEREPIGSLVVSRFDDPAPAACLSWQNCSLREAVIQANASAGENSIILGRGTYGLELAGAGEDGSVSGDLDVIEALNIIGFGADETIIDGNGLDRVIFSHSTNTKLRLFQLGVTGGSADVGAGVGGYHLSLERVAVQGNHAQLEGGGISSAATLYLTDSLVEGNSGATGAGLYASGSAYVRGSSFVGNTANTFGGGARFESYASLINSTFSGNAAARGGGVSAAAGGSLVNATFAENAATVEAEALWFEDTATWTTFNALFANTCGGSGAWTAGWSSYGGNLESPTWTCALVNPEDRMGIAEDQVLLQPLKDNGGPTPTHAVFAASVAFDTGLVSGTVRGDPANACPSIDQRGRPRPYGAGCDVGAYEYQEELIFASGFETGNIDEW